MIQCDQCKEWYHLRCLRMIAKTADETASYTCRTCKDSKKKPESLVENIGKMNVMSVSFLRLQSEKIALFYLLKNGLHVCKPYIKISSDECKTWSDSRLMITATGYFVMNNDRVIQLENGRLIAPVSFHRPIYSKRRHRRSRDCAKTEINPSQLNRQRRVITTRSWITHPPTTNIHYPPRKHHSRPRNNWHTTRKCLQQCPRNIQR